MRRWLIILLLLQPGLAHGSAEGPTPEVVAVRVADGTIRVDGRLDEPAWRDATPVAGFIQQHPRTGEPSTERTEVRILYDAESLYLGVILSDSQPDRIIADEMRRDGSLTRNDSFVVVLDPYHDHRNGYYFGTNPLGARIDGLIADEGRTYNFAWDGVWWAEGRITEDGWQTEIRIPFRTLRFDAQRLDPWGIQFKREFQRTNEKGFWSPIGVEKSIFTFSRAGHLHGLRDIRPGRHVELTPYAITALARTPSAGSPPEAEGQAPWTAKPNAGLDAKVSLTPGLTLDLTLNTDFAETEVDALQVNLTRFSLFFPEKRDFFLEGANHFAFGLPGALQPFFSRRIGLVAGRPVPILAGGKLTGKHQQTGVGLLVVKTQAQGVEPETTYAVLRVSQEVLARSNVGLIAINKAQAGTDGVNRTVGADVNFSLLRNLRLNSFLLESGSPEEAGNSLAWSAAGRWDGELVEAGLSYRDVGDAFNPEVGFVRRTGIERTALDLGFTPRPRGPLIRSYTLSTALIYMTDQAHQLATREWRITAGPEFESGDSVTLTYTGTVDRLVESGTINGLAIAAGTYTFDRLALRVSSKRGRWLSGTVSSSIGNFYGGTQVTGDGSLLARLGRHVGVTLTATHAVTRLPAETATTTLLGTRLDLNLTPRMGLLTFVQWDDAADRLVSNLRFRWEYRPGSEFFFVLLEDRRPGREDQAVTAKLTYLYSF